MCLLFHLVFLSCYVNLLFGQQVADNQVLGQAGHPDVATVDTDESELQESGPLGMDVQRRRFNLDTAEDECALFIVIKLF